MALTPRKDLTTATAVEYTDGTTVITADNLNKTQRTVLYNSQQIDELATGLSTKVEKGEVISAINQSAESVSIEASKIDLQGYVTFSSLDDVGFLTEDDLGASGKTVIDGGRIQTGTMSADRIEGGTLKVGGYNNQSGIISVVNASGAVTSIIDKNGIENNDTVTVSGSGTFKYRSILDSGGLSLYVDDTTTLGLWPFYEGTTASSAFSIYKTLYFIWGGGGNYLLRFRGLDGTGTPITFGTSTEFSASLTVRGTKSRIASTEHYNDRLLYCYEMPSPHVWRYRARAVG